MSWYDDQGALQPGRKPGVPNKVPRIRPGDRFGKWTIIRKAENRQHLCRCKCGAVRRVYTDHLTRGRSLSCGCGRPSGDDHYKYAGYGEITGNFWNNIKRGASRKKGRSYAVAFEITIEYAWKLFLRQKRRCALSGLPLTMTNQEELRTASLDRIDSKLGYLVGNVQWVHKDVNRMKNTFSQQRFIEVCRAVAGRHPG